jgi:hypothetical protein
MEGAVSRAPTRRCYKFLAAGGIGRFSGYRWPLPAGDRPGAPVSVGGDLDACRRGLHACRVRDLPYWLDDELWAAEAAEPVIEYDGVLVTRRARLLWRVEAWDQRAAVEFALACALRARDHAVSVLRRAGREREAGALERCAGLGDIQRVVGTMTGGHPAVRVAGYASDAAAHAPAYPLVTALITARAAGAGLGQAAAATGYRAERDWQARWLAERLRLEAPDRPPPGRGAATAG